MKKFSIITIALLIGAFIFAGCHRDDDFRPNPGNRPEGGGSTGGGGGTEQPAYDKALKLESAYSYGDFYLNGGYDFLFTLISSNFKSTTSTDKEGNEVETITDGFRLTLDIISKTQILMDGSYSFSEMCEPGTFGGWDYSQGLSASFYQDYFEENNGYFDIESGGIVISNGGKHWDITIKYKDEETFSYTFDGKLDIIDDYYEYQAEKDSKLNMNVAFTQNAVCTYNYLEDLNGTHFSTEFKDDNQTLFLDFVLSGKGTTIPYGTYTVSQGVECGGLVPSSEYIFNIYGDLGSIYKSGESAFYITGGTINYSADGISGTLSSHYGSTLNIDIKGGLAYTPAKKETPAISPAAALTRSAAGVKPERKATKREPTGRKAR